MKRWQIAFLVLLVAGTVLILRRNQPQPIVYQQNEGYIFGTVFHAKYQHDKSLEEDIMAELNAVDASLSMFNPNSLVSRYNSGDEEVIADSLFEQVFRQAMSICEATDGAFDPTVAPLVNAWGFGIKKGVLPDSLSIDSMLEYVGWRKVTLEDGHLKKADERIVMDFSAIAKGYGADRVAQLFERKNIENYMIEIGGEIVCKGKNPNGGDWKIGINRPTEDNNATADGLQTILVLSDCAVATSGNYRNYFVKDGIKYAHTINPHTGRPVQRSIVSSTVLAPSCAMADGFATAFMVTGLEEAKRILSTHPELKAYFIYTDEEGAFRTWSTGNIPEEQP